MGGSNSPFRINVDGISASSHQNIQLEGNDSLFIFVEVTLDVNNQNSPLIIEDSVRFKTNGLDQYVKLAVWGQDAYFYYNDTVHELCRYSKNKHPGPTLRVLHTDLNHWF